MARAFWWANTLAAQVLLVQNFIAKIGGYKDALGWTNQQVVDAEALGNMIINAINSAN